MPSLISSEAASQQGKRLDRLIFKLWMALTVAAAVLAVGATITLFVTAWPMGASIALVSTIALASLLAVGGIERWKEKIYPKCLRDVVNVVYAFAIEIIAILGCMVLFPFKIKDETISRSQTPVLLVHGFMHNSSGFRYIRSRLRQGGAGQIFTINFGNPFTQSISGNFVEKLRSKVKEIAAQTGRTDLLIIGHSMGGVVSTDFLLSDKRSDIGLVTLGSPLEGTYMAYIGLGPSAREMRPNSAYIQALHEKQKNFGKKLDALHIGSHADFIICPTKSACGPTWNHATHTFSDMGHVTYFFSDRVADQLLQKAHEPSNRIRSFS